MAPCYPLRFFRVVAPVPGLVGWSFLVVAIIDAVAITSDPVKAPGAIVPVLVMQLFAASSGFAVPARRGHYDLLLTGGYSRVWMAVVHWLTSITPGIVTWLVVAGVELAVTARARASLLAFGTCAAMGLVSTLPWALTVRLPRFSGGIGWLLVLASSTTVFPSVQMIASPYPSSDLEGMAWAAWSFLVYPPSLVGQALSAGAVLIAMPALVVAGCAMAAACRWILRASVPLEAAQ